MRPSNTSRLADSTEDLANILPTDFGLQAPAAAVERGLPTAKALLSGLLRFRYHLAKVRVAGSNPVVRSKKVQVVRGIF